ncbi:1-phosphofructokinase [Georgenia soli]|uniref:1-phosphofructokinase n=1 Tax=Georgenia soli TaxID=638953 RepID=A0A2A9EMD0_9MICO|nr:PfkB family carbohydrate kinase [Georgenia soli]PFG39963.1 1-phosphofructokinase [Georgenia soli]
MSHPTPDHEDRTEAPDAGPRLSVLAVGPMLEVTVETLRGEDEPHVHVHAGGQGLWVARMAKTLGARPVVCAPFGGEAGVAAAALARAEGLDLRTTSTPDISAHVLDYRGGEREELVVMRSPALDRHAQDDLYGTMLVHSMDVDLAVLTGADPDLGVPDDFFGRLAQDLRAADRPVVADLSGDHVRQILRAEGVVLKISHEEMLEGGFAEDAEVATLRDSGRRMLEEGLRALVISRADDPTLVVTHDEARLYTAPQVSTREHKGAGDSMTAGIAVTLARGGSLDDAVRLGAAAGALNVTRRGLGTGRRDQIEAFADRVSVEPA